MCFNTLKYMFFMKTIVYQKYKLFLSLKFVNAKYIILKTLKYFFSVGKEDKVPERRGGAAG